MPPDVRFLGQNAPKSFSAGAPPQTPLGELTALLQTPSWIKGGLLLREERGREGKGGRARDGKGGLINLCYLILHIIL